MVTGKTNSVPFCVCSAKGKRETVYFPFLLMHKLKMVKGKCALKLKFLSVLTASSYDDKKNPKLHGHI